MAKNTPESPLKVVGADHPAGAAPMVSTKGWIAPVMTKMVHVHCKLAGKQMVLQT